MNCKPGDLAVIVRSKFGNDWKLVRVHEASPLNGMPFGTRALVRGNEFVVSHDNAFGWVVEALGEPIKKEHRAYRFCPAPDKCLRPIRDPGADARDETLTWADKPERVTA
jgi:hypothetical protein